MTKQRLAARIAPVALALAAAIAAGGCDRDATPLPAASDAAAVPTLAASMPATTADPAATAALRSFAGRDANNDGFITSAENGAAEARIFNAMDSDGDGAMTVPELDGARVALGLVTLPGSEELIGDADQDGDKQLTLAEWMGRQGEAFDSADADHDGRLSQTEYAAQPRLETPVGKATAEAESTAGAG